MTDAAPEGLVTMTWNDVLIATWAVDPMVVTHLVPAQTQIDSWNGQALLSLAGLRVRHLQVGGIAVPFYQDFEQIHFRLAVRREIPNEVRRGVVFIRQVVPSAVMTLGARLLFNENCLAAQTRREITSGEKGWTSYEWMLDARWNRLSAVRGGPAFTPHADSVETFIQHRPWGFTRQPDGSTMQHHVDYPNWEVHATDEMMLECDLARLFGPEYVPILSREPIATFVALGSTVALRETRAI